eukprot:CAMPEP_0201590178 /NCGR_PEP_ID=MMETSP0190_2-20130828/175038_1 /ASSEMBLY_ACC=CAM_ASM_000263 /TAXON_ID=37353 /ORGANISM="Rosalina sp." /LENGTH=176 /DNA_ID=CAMNT_0048045801 /DNA_START=568 /DNA_END=1095 /DNA_ORIENTATION=+
MNVKKNPDPDSIQLRTVITTAPFDKIKDVVQTNRQALSYAALSSPSPSTSAQPSVTPQVKPWLTKVKKAPSHQQLLAKADNLLENMKSSMGDIEKRMNDIQRTDDILDWSNLDEEVPPVFATPPVPRKVSVPKAVSYESQEHIVFEQVGMVMDINANSESDEKRKSNVVNLLLSGW